MKAFDKIIGYDLVKEELYQVIDMFKNKEKYEKIGATFPKNLIIFGPAGLGKTTLANALIEECGVKTYVVKKDRNSDELVDVIKNTFEEAAKNEPSIIELDDMDKFSEREGHNIDDETFVAVQTGIDSVKDKNVFVVATVNNYIKLPRSLVRNGRFTRKIALEVPKDKDAEKIIEYYLKTKCIDDNLNIEDVVKMISYSSCADLEAVINEASIYSAYQNKEKVDIEDIVKAHIRCVRNLQDTTSEYTQETMDAVAMHEAAHCCVAEVIKEGSIGFVMVHIKDKDKIGGVTHQCFEMKTKQDEVLISLAGKAALELFYRGGCARGCCSDMEKAYGIIKGELTNDGICGISLFGSPNTDMQEVRVETAIKAELERNLFIVRDILMKNKEFLMKLTDKLKEKRHLLYSDIREIRNQVEITKVAY